MKTNNKFEKWLENKNTLLKKNLDEQEKYRAKIFELQNEFNKINNALPDFDITITFEDDVYVSEPMGVGKRYEVKGKSITFKQGLAEVYYKDVNVAGISPLKNKETVSLPTLLNHARSNVSYEL